MEKFYITTAIDYANARPHIGHALEKIQADVLARYYRRVLGSDKVWFLTGTDEHGAKIARAAAASGKSPQDFVDSLAADFRAMKDYLSLSWDDFIRTTDTERHWPGVKKIWECLIASGDLYKKKYKGLYCVGHEAFVTEKELVDGKCPDHQKEPEVVEEENYFFKLSKYADAVRDLIRSGELTIVPEARRNEMLSFIESGLEDVSFSRSRKSLSWGMPVPGDEEHSVYVWADALTNYISAIGYGRDEAHFKKWWPADVHVVGKDILRFHAVIWPAMLLSAGLPLPKQIFVHGFITVKGRKMSKTVGNVLDPKMLAEKYGTDPLRYYLLREIPSGDDGDFSEEKFKERYNADLANGLGNFAARVLALAEPLGTILNVQFDNDVVAEAIKTKAKIKDSIERFKLNEALDEIWKLIRVGDTYVNDKKPWQINDIQQKLVTIATLVYLLGSISYFVEPFLPETSQKIESSLVIKGKNIIGVFALNLGADGGGFFVRKQEKSLFPRIS